MKPLSEGNELFQGVSEVPEKIASYYEVNDVKRFQLDRPIHKGPVDKDNEFKVCLWGAQWWSENSEIIFCPLQSLWIERTFLVIAHPLPGILRWFEVVRKSVELIPPVQFACETMEAMNRELKQLTAVYHAEPKRNINPFSMRLQVVGKIFRLSCFNFWFIWNSEISQGIIDANVMGGVAKYQQAFLGPDFAQNYSEYLPFVVKLKTLLTEQVRAPASGLLEDYFSFRLLTYLTCDCRLIS